MVLLALLALPTALLGPALLSGRALLPADLLIQFEPWRSAVPAATNARWDPLIWDGITQYYPWRAFAAESLRAGVIPLWNPYQFCGTPFLANGQSAVLYPLNLLFWLLPVATAFGWSAWLHLALTGWFMYLFLRRVGLARAGAVAGAIVWQGNGFLAAWIHLPTVLCTAAWLPLVLLLLERALVTGRIRFAAAAGCALGLSYLGGHPQVFMFVALLAVCYGLVRAFSREIGVHLGVRMRRLVTVGATTTLFAAGSMAAQLLPTLDLLRIAHRSFTPGHESYRAFLSHAMPPLQLGGLLLPHAFGHPALTGYAGRDNYAEFACYVGIVALTLALWAAFACRRWHARFFTGAVLVVLLIALGTTANWPLYQWLPGFARSGGPGRILLLAVCGLAALAGMGVDELSRASTRSVIGLVLIIGALMWGRIIWTMYVTPALAQLQPGILEFSTKEGSRVGALLWAAVIPISLCARRPRVAVASRVSTARGASLQLATIALIPLLALDLFFAAQGHLHIVPRSWVYPRVETPAPGAARILGNATDWPIDRIPHAVMPPNAATVYHLRDAFGYDSLYLARYRDFAAALQHGDPSPPLNGNMLLARFGPVYGLDMLSLVGVETVLSPTPVPGLRMERAGAYYTLTNPYAYSRAWVARAAVFVPTHPDAVASLVRLGVMSDTVIITGSDDLAAEPVTGDPKVTVKDTSPNTVEVAVGGGGGGYLFLADAYAPRWRAYGRVKGTETKAVSHPLALPIRPANVAFRVVAMPPAIDTVTFRYQPDSFRVGLFVSLLAWAAVAAAVAAALIAPGHRDG